MATTSPSASGRSCSMAREEASALRHEYVGTEHILLGLCEGGGVAEHALTKPRRRPEMPCARTVSQVVKPGKADGAR